MCALNGCLQRCSILRPSQNPFYTHTAQYSQPSESNNCSTTTVDFLGLEIAFKGINNCVNAEVSSSGFFCQHLSSSLKNDSHIMWSFVTRWHGTGRLDWCWSVELSVNRLAQKFMLERYRHSSQNGNWGIPYTNKGSLRWWQGSRLHWAQGMLRCLRTHLHI